MESNRAVERTDGVDQLPPTDECRCVSAKELAAENTMALTNELADAASAAMPMMMPMP
ncbi:MAG: hypothetical protein M1815_004400 [Lichina confinis]|nr:MAG: hypothetical protein M1815_004400 [Lichina confinis]